MHVGCTVNSVRNESVTGLHNRIYIIQSTQSNCKEQFLLDSHCKHDGACILLNFVLGDVHKYIWSYISLPMLHVFFVLGAYGCSTFLSHETVATLPCRRGSLFSRDRTIHGLQWSKHLGGVFPIISWKNQRNLRMMSSCRRQCAFKLGFKQWPSRIF